MIRRMHLSRSQQMSLPEWVYKPFPNWFMIAVACFCAVIWIAIAIIKIRHVFQ